MEPRSREDWAIEWEADSDVSSIDPEKAEELFRSRNSSGGARRELVEMFQPFATSHARRFAGRGEPLEDLSQVAMIGLINAVDRFDPSRGVQFTTFASATIVGELKRHLRDKGWSVRVPRRIQEEALRVSNATGVLVQELGRSPTVAEIAIRAFLTEEEVLEAMQAGRAYTSLSLDAPLGDEGDDSITVADRVLGETEELQLVERLATVAPAVRSLADRQQRILYLRFYEDRSQTEIAEELGISQMHVSRLLGRALETLRSFSEERDLPVDESG